MNATLAPANLVELTDAVRSTPHLLAVGAGTKPRLSAVEVTKLSMTRLSGIVEYEPSEFTFTALAGTPLREIVEVLGKSGQHLPFDPPLVEAGATIGGAVAAGLSGAGRYRFGGMRDFILGARFVDGAARLLRMGGKVVKNAAGFDLPKFFVGSLGRFGVLAELTFKVFPRPTETTTLRVPVGRMDEAAKIFWELTPGRWEPEAFDMLPDGGGICLRLAGPGRAIREYAREIFTRWPGEILSVADAAGLWSALSEFRWAHDDGPFVKLVMTPDILPALGAKVRAMDGALLHVSAAGNVAYVSLPTSAGASQLASAASELGLRGLALRGEAPLWYGLQTRPKIAQAVKDALDPVHRFPALDD
jgi:glycolate oxidase FAD binding subunit